MSYTLSISLTDEQREAFYTSGQRIVIAKPQEGAGPKVAWQVLRPMGESSVNWEEEYGIYASYEAIENGALLKQMSSTEGMAAKGKVYTLYPAGVFKVTGDGPESEPYYADNEFSGPNELLSIGLYQDATVNGKAVAGNAVSVAPVGRGEQAAMTTYTTVYVWMQAEVVSNSVLTQVTSTKTKAVFGDGVGSIALEYDSTSGVFIPKADTKLAEGASVESPLRVAY